MIYILDYTISWLIVKQIFNLLMIFFVENKNMVEIKGKDIVFRIDSILKERNLKRKAVADAIGISLQPFTSWANRGSIPGADIAYHIAEYLNVSVEWLLTGKEQKSEESLNNLPPPEILELAEDIYRLPVEFQKIIIGNVEDYKALCFKLEKESTQGIG